MATKKAVKKVVKRMSKATGKAKAPTKATKKVAKKKVAKKKQPGISSAGVLVTKASGSVRVAKGMKKAHIRGSKDLGYGVLRYQGEGRSIVSGNAGERSQAQAKAFLQGLKRLKATTVATALQGGEMYDGGTYLDGIDASNRKKTLWRFRWLAYRLTVDGFIGVDASDTRNRYFVTKKGLAILKSM